MVVRLIAAGAFLSASVHAYSAAAQSTPPREPVQLLAQAMQPQPLRADSSVAESVSRWNRLRQSDSYSFTDYAGFLVSHPGWPGETAMRRAAERAINPENYQPGQVVSYFERMPAITTTGEARHALALLAMGRIDQARAAARRAWTGGALTPLDEGRILSAFGGALTPEDHDQRMERLLWEGAANSAVRQLGLTSPARRAGYEARIALLTKAPDASAKAAALGDQFRNDPGYIVARAGFLRTSGNAPAARALLAQPRRLSAPAFDAEEWFETLLTNARGAANDGQWSVAYGIASQVDDAYAPGTEIRDRPIGERDDYTSLVWLAGTTALQKLGRPADAVGMFERYALAARSPQTQSKGFYWAGRAALSAGQHERADGYFRRASAFSDQFYGQLSLERLGQRVPPPSSRLSISPSAAEREAFNASSIVRATRYLGQTGNWTDQTQFLRAISTNAKSDLDHHFASELSEQIRRPDLGVMIGRSANLNGHNDYIRTGFPVVSLPSGHEQNFTMIHAITRQESQFDRQAVSHAGARGLMQLMPGTARETSGKIGEAYNLSGLTGDPMYNIRLGSTYFDSMLRYFGGSYPLAVAAYNAGPGNVNKWLRANGDPRGGGIDILDWIEAIPIFETRNYVQRVLENAVVYDAMYPDRARARGSATPLSWYLGKRVPG